MVVVGVGGAAWSARIARIIFEISATRRSMSGMISVSENSLPFLQEKRRVRGLMTALIVSFWSWAGRRAEAGMRVVERFGQLDIRWARVDGVLVSGTGFPVEDGRDGDETTGPMTASAIPA